MIRVLARFADHSEARAGIDALVAGSFPAEDLSMHAQCSDGTHPEVPIVVQSHLIYGFFLGGAIAAPIGALVAWFMGWGSPASFGIVASGVGCTIGAALGLGSWRVQPDPRQIPGDAEGFVVAVVVPEGRAEHANRLLHGVGGREAGPHLIT